MASQHIAINGIPLDAGSTTRGCLMGPDAMRVAGLNAALEDLGHTVSDLGNLNVGRPANCHPESDACLTREVAAWTKTISHAVACSLSQQRVPLLVGGDHAMSIGSVTALASHAKTLGRPQFVLWLDAHTDFNTFETSPTGNIHGMPVACFCGLPGFEPLLGPDHDAFVKPANVLMLGIRSIDDAERKLVRAHGIGLHDMRSIDEHGVVGPLRTFLDRVRAENGLLHVSLDVDFLDPDIAPGVGTTVPGGVTLREAHLIMELLAESELITSMEVAELNPSLDVAGKTAQVAVDLVASAFGRTLN